jgi:hypothetical protein
VAPPAFVVAAGQSRLLDAGAFGSVTVGGTLRLSGSSYAFAGLDFANDATLVADEPSVVRVAGRATGQDRGRIPRQLLRAPVGARAPMHLTLYALYCIMASMLEVLTTDEFAAWFDELEDGPAEDVATALEMIEKLGPLRAAPGSSEWLLWYEHREAPEFVAVDDWAEFRDSAKEVVTRLEQPGFAAKLRALPREDARRVMVAIDALRMESAIRRRGLAMLVAEVAARTGQPADPYAVLRQAYQTVAAATGLAVGDLPVHSSALRELSVSSPASRSRILYGVELRRSVALVVVGERLDRSFYGDTVRRAEAVWQQFLQRSTEARDPLAPR